jgi:hypothetical protein
VSYLSGPRFHFAGTYLADPSTVNNRADNVAGADVAEPDAIAAFRDRAWAVTGPGGTGGTGLWNPNGSHAFSFKNVTVRSAVGADGGPVTGDPVVGLTLATPGRPPAKLVDLDPDQQLASTIFGLGVTLRDGAGTVFLRASLTPVPFTDIWSRLTSGGGDGSASAAYQSTLTDLRWGDVSASLLLTQLRAAAGDGLLSIKFNVDGYAGTQAGGRIVGTVGVATAGEPAHTVLGRQFGGREIGPLPVAFPGFRPRGKINFFAGVVDEAARKIRLDLGNAVPAAAPGAAAPALGELTLAYRDDGGTVTPLAPIDYRHAGWYERTAGVVDLPADRALTGDELAQVADHPLLIVAVNDGQPSVAIEETPVHVRADMFIARLDPETPWVVRFHVTERGKPKANAQVILQVSRPPGPEDAVTRLLAGLELPPSPVTSDQHGVAEATLTAHDPGSPRFYNDGSGERGALDGQVYMIRYAVAGVAAVNPSNVVSVLVWNRFPTDPEHPLTWNTGIGAIFRPYGNLYPFMTLTQSVDLDLAVYEKVAERSLDIAVRLGLPITDPLYMPVTRDLSGQKTQAILAWLDNPGPDGNPLLGPPAVEGIAPVPEPVAPVAAPAPVAVDPQDVALGSKTAFARRLARAEGVDPP